MMYCKGCDCVIVPGRAFLAADGYYCPHCVAQHWNTLSYSLPGKRQEGGVPHVQM